MAELGWHLQLWIDVKDLPQTIPVLKRLGLPVVIDHMVYGGFKMLVDL